jgi:hypothetical protein
VRLFDLPANRPDPVRGRVCAPHADARGLVVSSLCFFPRGGSAQVARSLARALPAAGWQPTLAAGSLGRPGEPTHAASFFADIDVHALDYSAALELAELLAAPVPFQPSYEDSPDAPDRIFAALDDPAYERFVAAWIDLLTRAGAGAADLLHLHHLTPANEAAARGFPSLPVLGQLHGTELGMLRTIEAGAPPAGATQRLGAGGCAPGRGAAPCWSCHPGRRRTRPSCSGSSRRSCAVSRACGVPNPGRRVQQADLQAEPNFGTPQDVSGSRARVAREGRRAERPGAATRPGPVLTLCLDGYVDRPPAAAPPLHPGRERTHAPSRERAGGRAWRPYRLAKQSAGSTS